MKPWISKKKRTIFVTLLSLMSLEFLAINLIYKKDSDSSVPKTKLKIEKLSDNSYEIEKLPNDPSSLVQTPKKEEHSILKPKHSLSETSLPEQSLSEHSLIDQFEDMIREATEKMPTTRELRQASNEDVHRTPAPILEAGHRMGKIAQFLNDHPEMKNQGIRFYQDCSTRDEFPTSVRALCFFLLKANDPETIDRENLQIPDEVKKLADNL